MNVNCRGTDAWNLENAFYYHEGSSCKEVKQQPLAAPPPIAAEQPRMKNSPLYGAVKRGKLKEAEKLLKSENYRPDWLYAQDAQGHRLESVFHLLARSENKTKRNHQLKLARLLVKKGLSAADTTSGTTPLFYALERVNVSLADFLLRKGAKLGRSNKGSTWEPPLWFAVHENSLELVELLLKHGADIGDRRSGKNIMHVLAEESREPNIEMLQLLVRYKAPIDEGDGWDDATPLHFAVKTDKKDMVALLLDHGADIERASSTGMFPLYLAAAYCRSSVVEMLLKKGADVHRRLPDGSTALHSATAVERNANIKLLLNYGADVYAVNNHERTPFSIPSVYGMHATKKLLLKHMAIVEVRDGIRPSAETMKSMKSSYWMFYLDCVSELTHMQRNRIHLQVTFFSVLLLSVTNDKKGLLQLLGNSNFVRVYETFNRKRRFPIYFEDLDAYYRAESNRKLQEREVEKKLKGAFDGHLPEELIIKIVELQMTE